MHCLRRELAGQAVWLCLLQLREVTVGLEIAVDIPRTQILNQQGQLVDDLPSSVADPETIRDLYSGMVLTRAFDTKAIALQRTGRIGTYASSLGQEAVSVGLAAAMRPEDVLLPSFREHGAQLWRGVSLVELFLFWGGDERGHDFAVPREDFPVSIPVASHAPHTVGVAMAMKLRRESRAAVCVLGDGATSKGDFYEALNAAGVWNLPALFVVTNNQWAISVPRSAQSAAETLAQKAIAAGIPGVQVDGNDVLAVRHVAGEALERARNGEGPTLIEALTYRLSDHTTADDASRYRSDEIVSEWWKAEPIARLRAYMIAGGIWDAEREERLLSECRAEVDAASERYFETEPEEPAAIFDNLYKTLPPGIAAQRAKLLEEEGADG